MLFEGNGYGELMKSPRTCHSRVNTLKEILIAENLIEGNVRDCISLYENAEATITGNTIEANMGDGVRASRTLATIMDNTIEANMGDGVDVPNFAEATITGNEIRNNAGRGIYIDNNSCVVINGGTIADSGDSGVFLEEASAAEIGFGSEAVGALTLTQNKGAGITIVDDGSSALINRAQVVFDANGGGEIVGLSFTEDPGEAEICCFMP